MLLALDCLHDGPANVRHVKATPEQDKALAASMNEVGLIQPIVVMANGEPGHFIVMAGHRRLAAARALGWDQIECSARPMTTEDRETAISAAENMVRAAMHPVDQWRAVTAMIETQGYSVERAARALGLDVALARRLRCLGQMHPDMVETIAGGDLPDTRYLRTIAMAPHEAQLAALTEARERSNGRDLDWYYVAQLCTRDRISRSAAIFDADKSGLVFDEDLFAEPGSPQQFTTADVRGFIAKQKEVLADAVAKDKKKGGRLTFAEWGKTGLVLPAGWQTDGYEASNKPLKKSDPNMIFTGVCEDGYRLGQVMRVLGVPVAAKADKSTASGSASKGDADGGAGAGYSAKALDLIAARKTDAVRSHLRANGETMAAPDLLAALVLALSGSNVSIQGGMYPGYRGRFADLIPMLFTPDGRVRTYGVEAVAAEALARIVVCASPKSISSSGPAAEWIGDYIGVPPPRLDDAESLALLKGDVLRDAARLAGVAAPAGVGAMRSALVGKLENWTPAVAQFAAPPPAPVDDDDDGAEADADEGAYDEQDQAA